MIPALTLVLVFMVISFLCVSWRLCDRNRPCGLERPIEFELSPQERSCRPLSWSSFSWSVSPSPHFTSVRRRAGRLQPELLLLVAPSLPASKAGLQISSRFHGCVSFPYRIWRLFPLCPPSLIRA